jgi:hypothetical protein
MSCYEYLDKSFEQNHIYNHYIIYDHVPYKLNVNLTSYQDQISIVVNVQINPSTDFCCFLCPLIANITICNNTIFAHICFS